MTRDEDEDEDEHEHEHEHEGTKGRIAVDPKRGDNLYKIRMGRKESER